MKLIAFKYGATEITERMAFQNGSEDKKLPIALLYFLIEYKDKKILVDVGCDTMPGFELYEFQKPVLLLNSYGVKPSEITDVIITHAHNDHIGAIRYYPQANVFLHKEEAESANPYIDSATKLHLLDGDTTIFEGIEFKHVGGHTAGSGIVLLKSDDKTFLLCGDECYTKDNLLCQKPTGSSFCLEKSTFFVQKYGKGDFYPILFHDTGLVDEIGYKILFETV